MKRYKSRFKHYSEKRRNPEMNPHISAWDYLDRFKNDPNVYISFTEIDKIGINPQSKYNTPVGIYCYPLKEFVKNYCFNPPYEYNKDRYSVGFYAPFAGSAKYINFIRIKDKANFIEDMYREYTSRNYDRDLKILDKIYSNNFKTVLGNPYSGWDGFIKLAVNSARVKNPIVTMWNITRELALYLSNSNEKQTSTKWNLILSKDLGYSGFADKSGKGYIHPSEPMQAVFFNTRAFDVITRIENKPAKKIGGNKGI